VRSRESHLVPWPRVQPWMGVRVVLGGGLLSAVGSYGSALGPSLPGVRRRALVASATDVLRREGIEKAYVA
jgi:hypothetical protein